MRSDVWVPGVVAQPLVETNVVQQDGGAVLLQSDVLKKPRASGLRRVVQKPCEERRNQS